MPLPLPATSVYSGEHGGQPKAFVWTGWSFHERTKETVGGWGPSRREEMMHKGVSFTLEGYHACHWSSCWEVIAQCGQVMEVA